MSIKNQILIASKIKSIDPNFIPRVEVDSRASPDERELEFMAEVVIAVNNLKNVRNVNKIFFNRQVKSYNHYGPRQQTVRSYRDGTIELYVNLHHHNFNINQTLSCITSERNQEFIRTRQSYENVNFVKAEVNEVVKAEVKEEIIVKTEVKEEIIVKTEVKEVAVKEVKEIEMNDEKITIQESVFGYDDVCGDDGESWVVFSPKIEVEEEEVSMNVAVNDEVKEEIKEEVAVEVSTSEAVDSIINSEKVFFEDIDYNKATEMIVDQCVKVNAHVSSEVIRSALIEKVKVASNFGEAPKNDERHHYKIHESEFEDGTYVFYIERDADDFYSVPQRFIPNQEFEVYSFKKYENMFESFFDEDDRFEYVGIVSTQMYESDGRHFVEHRSLMSRFFSDEEILSSKPADDESSNEDYIEWARSNDHDRIDRYVVAIREIIL